MNALEISRTGLDVEWRRLEIIADNLANLSTTRTASGDPYRPKRLVSGPRASFAATLGKAAREVTDPGGVMVYGIEPTNAEPRRVYEPNHPHADAQGFVTYPGVDHAGEMVSLVATSRAYEANVVAMSIAGRMYAKALEIGHR